MKIILKPVEPEASRRVGRCGSWYDDAEDARVSDRSIFSGLGPSYRLSVLGFRLARNVK